MYLLNADFLPQQAIRHSTLFGICRAPVGGGGVGEGSDAVRGTFGWASFESWRGFAGGLSFHRAESDGIETVFTRRDHSDEEEKNGAVAATPRDAPRENLSPSEMHTTGDRGQVGGVTTTLHANETHHAVSSFASKIAPLNLTLSGKSLFSDVGKLNIASGAGSSSGSGKKKSTSAASKKLRLLVKKGVVKTAERVSFGHGYVHFFFLISVSLRQNDRCRNS